MQITIHFMGQARLAAGCEQTTLEISDGSLVRAAMDAAVRERGDLLREFLFHDDGRPRRSVLLVVGQQQVSWDWERPLCSGEVLTVLPPIAGGAAS